MVSAAASAAASGSADAETPRRVNLGPRRLSSAPSGSTVEVDDPIASQLETWSLVGYRSSGLGVFGTVLRYAGMPLEKFALFLNSSQVSGSGQAGQAWRLTIKDGYLSPFRVVGPASLTAWFFQYAAMGLIFESVDITLSRLLGVPRAVKGVELLERPDPKAPKMSPTELATMVGKSILAPTLSGSIEAGIANRAEVQRFFGPQKFSEVLAATKPNAFTRAVGPAFAANAGRNFVMSSTSFVITPFLCARPPL